MSNTLKFGAGNWATKEGSTLAYNDENGNFKPLPFDFSRDSSATVINKDGLIEEVASGQPRIDYKDDSNGALLLEPSRTNIITYSEDFENFFNTTEINLTPNYAVSPKGTQNANKVSFPSFSNSMYKSSLNYTGTHNVSFYVKGEGSNIGKTFNLRLQGTSTDQYLTVPITEEWVRVEYNTEGLRTFEITNRYNTTIGDGSLILYGFQLEQGSYPTSYIPTQGSAVTRLRDLCDTENLSHVIGQTEGVIFYDAILVHKSTSTSEDLFELSIDDGSANNIFFINNYNNTLAVSLNNGGSNQFYSNSYNPTEGARYKLAFAYKQNDFALYINRNQIATDSSGTVTTMNQITFGNYYNNQLNLSNIVKVNNLKLYNTRLSNSELAALTQV